MPKFSSRSGRKNHPASKPWPLGVERLEDRLTPAYYSVPAAAQTLAAIGIPAQTYGAPTGPTYYVSPTGTGGPSTNASAPGNARQTLTSNSLPNNATIVFQQGTDGIYRDLPSSQTGGLSIGKTGLTLQAAPGAKPWILGSKVATGWSAATNVTFNGVSTPLSYTSNTSNSWLRSFDAEADYGSYFNNLEEVDANTLPAQKLDMVFVDGQSYKQVLDDPNTPTIREGNDWFGPGTFWVGKVGTETRVYLGANPAGKQIEVTAYGRAIQNFSGGDDLTIRGIGFAHFAFIPIDYRSARTTVRDSTFAWNGYAGLAFDGTTNNGAPVDNKVQNSRFVANGSMGLFSQASDRLLVDGNYIAYNNVERFRTAWTAAGVKVARTDDAIIRNNTVEGNFANGLWIDIDMFRTDIVKNLVRDNANQGIFVEISHDNVVAFNLVERNGGGILISSSSETRVYNNTVVDNGMAIRVMEDNRTQYTGANAAAGSTYDAYDNVIVNNLFVGVTGSILADYGNKAYFQTQQATIQVVRNNTTSTVPLQSFEFFTTLDWNVYFDTSSPVAGTTVVWDPTTTDGGMVSYDTLAAFKSARPAYEVNGKSVNPLFVLTGSTDWQRYALQSNSPAKGAVGVVPADILAAAGLSGQPNYLGAIAPVSPPPPPANSAPTNITLSNTSVPEGAAGAVVGTLSATDPNAGDTFTYSLDPALSNNWRFTVVGNQLKLATPPAAGTTSLWVTVRVTDSGNLTYDKSIQIFFFVNAAPTNVSLSNTTVAGNTPGAVVGTITGTDANTAAGDRLTYSLTPDQSNNWRFVIDGNQLKLATPPAAGTTSLWVTIRVTDTAGLWFEKAIQITIV